MGQRVNRTTTRMIDMEKKRRFFDRYLADGGAKGVKAFGGLKKRKSTGRAGRPRQNRGAIPGTKSETKKEKSKGRFRRIVFCRSSKLAQRKKNRGRSQLDGDLGKERGRKETGKGVEEKNARPKAMDLYLSREKEEKEKSIAGGVGSVKKQAMLSKKKKGVGTKRRVGESLG